MAFEWIELPQGDDWETWLRMRYATALLQHHYRVATIVTDARTNRMVGLLKDAGKWSPEIETEDREMLKDIEQSGEAALNRAEYEDDRLVAVRHLLVELNDARLIALFDELMAFRSRLERTESRLRQELGYVADSRGK